VALQVVDLDHRDVARYGEPFGERHAHQERAHQSGAAREGDGVHVADSDARFPQRRVHYRDDVLLVGARRQFGNHSAVLHVYGLRGDDVRQQDVVAQHGGRGVVARGFDAEYGNIHRVFRFLTNNS
jgi:hypothetical protein